MMFNFRPFELFENISLKSSVFLIINLITKTNGIADFYVTWKNNAWFLRWFSHISNYSHCILIINTWKLFFKLSVWYVNLKLQIANTFSQLNKLWFGTYLFLDHFNTIWQLWQKIRTVDLILRPIFSII